MTRHRSPPPAVIHCLLVRHMLHPQSRAPSPSVLPPSESLAPVSPAPLGRGHSVISRRPHRLTRAVLSRAPSFLPVRLPFCVCSPSVRHPSRAPFPFTPSMPFRAVWTPVTPSRMPWRTLAAVWCPVAFYYALLCPLGPLMTPSCRTTLPPCACAPLHVVWTPAVPRAALSCPLAPRCAMLCAVAPCCAAPRRLDRHLAPCRALSRPLPPRGAPASHSCATPCHLDLRAASSRRLAAPPNMSAPMCCITVPCAVAMVPAARQLATPRAFSLAADLRSGGPTGCVAAVHTLAMAHVAHPLAVPLALSPVYPSPTVSCRAGPSNGVGGTLSCRPTLESRHQHASSSHRLP
ncbi:hypothetical protein DENSPDRAFT_885826 [Dentipellis sp. KUC8613]|nr:hypothetical protein DENSPDRAFT_885826 [Dentipellis sp. KUC8613]